MLVSRLLKGIVLFKDWPFWIESRLGLLTGNGIFRMRNGIIFAVDFSNGFSAIPEVFIDDPYQKFYKIRNNDIVIDIGAHIGAFSVLAASKGAYVYAYEPTLESFKFLSKNTENYEKVKLFNLAVSDKNSEIRIFKWSEGNIGNTAVLKNISHDPNNESFPVKSISVNEVFKNINHCDLLKIDCEGSELAIFKAMSDETALKIRNISMEYHLNLTEMLILLKEKGFKMLKHDNGSRGYIYASRY